MARKVLTTLDLNGQLTIAGSGGTNGYFLKTDGFGNVSWAASGNGFSGAGTAVTTITGTSGTTLALSLPSVSSGNGTGISLTGGATSASAGGPTGGDIQIIAGAQTNNTVGGTGGSLTITGGASGTNGTGGSITLTGGAGGVNGGGNITINGGSSSGGNGVISIGTTNTDSITIGSTGKITTINGPVVLSAGTSTSNPLKFTANTSTPATTAGVIDYSGDLLSFAHSGTGMGRTSVWTSAIAYSNANSSNATSTTAVSIFQAGARTLALEAGKTYYFRLNLGLNYTHAGTSTIVRIDPTFSNSPVAINYNTLYIANTTVQQFRYTATGTQTISPGMSGSITGATVIIEGFFQSNATTGGTVEFKFSLSASNGATATMTTGSRQEIMKIGSGAPGVISGTWAG